MTPGLRQNSGDIFSGLQTSSWRGALVARARQPLLEFGDDFYRRQGPRIPRLAFCDGFMAFFVRRRGPTPCTWRLFCREGCLAPAIALPRCREGYLAPAMALSRCREHCLAPAIALPRCREDCLAPAIAPPRLREGCLAPATVLSRLRESCLAPATVLSRLRGTCLPPGNAASRPKRETSQVVDHLAREKSRLVAGAGFEPTTFGL